MNKQMVNVRWIIDAGYLLISLSQLDDPEKKPPRPCPFGNGPEASPSIKYFAQMQNTISSAH